ncbi:unnamed protein product [Mytilus coruscus]|uniref:Reverse transcriptase domain-containing protein n=1 Tax=Mytilus coruscus TaxID=42192 RepID=A0A6J8BRE4_MYTCO|nr:unnamed protein product [Mytilus coruscus]
MIADDISVSQVVRQGGILSTDLYKVYVNPLLNRLQQSGLGCKIGNVLCNSTACADDIALLGKRPPDMQAQINISPDYAGMEGYKLQLQKSVAIHIQPRPTKNSCEPEQYQLGKDPMPNVTKSTHLGIIKTPSMRQNIESNVEENVKKARKSAYALLGSGFHGENGLDPESLIHLFKTYISPVLLYGMELLTPKSAHLETLEKFQKKMHKQILSVPMSTPDPAIYILTGILPVEAQIHAKMITFFCSICQQADNSVEKQLGKRQLTVKSSGSHSWYIEIQRIMFKYNLGRALDMLDNADVTKTTINQIKRQIANYWVNGISVIANLYQGLKYLQTDNFMAGRIHNILKIKSYTNKDRFRIPMKLKLLTETYALQPLRYKIYKEGNQEICNACSQKEETVEHLLIECKAWDNIRRPVINDIESLLTNHSNTEWESLSEGFKIQILMDITMVQRQLRLNSEEVSKIEHQARRLIFLIHSARCKLLLQP